MKYRALLWASHRGLASVAAWPSRRENNDCDLEWSNSSVQPRVSQFSQMDTDKCHVLETMNVVFLQIERTEKNVPIFSNKIII